MLKVNDFICPAQHSTEVFSKGQPPESIECPECGQTAHKALAAPRAKLDGTTGDFPGEAMKWTKRREEKMRQEQRFMREHGDYGNRKW